MIENLTYHYRPKQDLPLAYNPFLDRNAYLKAGSKERERLNPYTRTQLETHIGERFNVLLSTVRYDIRDGHLYGQSSDEPAIELFARGVGREGSITEDLFRENAEVLGFSQTDEALASPSAKVGDKWLSISPPGGSYQHNFYDIFTLKEDEGERYVEMRRYSSGLGVEQAVLMLKEAGVIDESYRANAEYSLSHPINIGVDNLRFITPDDIHQYLHRNHEYTSQEDFSQILRICTPLITSYINTLVENPYDLQTQLLSYNALLYQADLAHDAIKTRDYSFLRGLLLKSEFSYLSQRDIEIMGTQPIRQAMIGCGFSGGFNVSSGSEIMTSPFSVAEKGTQKATEKQILCCTCPFCNKQVEAEIGGGRITCPNCKKSASWEN